jgi:hypothetical protein
MSSKVSNDFHQRLANCGGPAFPNPVNFPSVGGSGYTSIEIEQFPGMTLRDVFALKWIDYLMTAYDPIDYACGTTACYAHMQIVAKAAYKAADVLLDARDGSSLED